MRLCPLLFVCLLLWSCTRTVYVPVTERRNVYTTVRDTVLVFTERGDTVERMTPDTVSLIAYKGVESEARIVDGMLQHRLAVQARRDSVRVEVRERLVVDSVQYPVYVDGMQENKPRAWMWKIVAIAVIAVAGICLLRILRR